MEQSNQLEFPTTEFPIDTASSSNMEKDSRAECSSQVKRGGGRIETLSRAKKKRLLAASISVHNSQNTASSEKTIATDAAAFSAACLFREVSHRILFCNNPAYEGIDA